MIARNGKGRQGSGTAPSTSVCACALINPTDIIIRNTVWFVGVSFRHIMRVGLALAVLLSALLRWPLNLQPLCVAGGQPTPWPQTTGLRVQYTLIIANSPDCEPSLVDSFPVRVQYRTIMTGGDGGQNNNVSQWMDSPRIPGSYTCLHIMHLSMVRPSIPLPLQVGAY